MTGRKQKALASRTRTSSWCHNRGFKDVPSVKHASRPRRIDVGTLDPAARTSPDAAKDFSLQSYAANDLHLVSLQVQCNDSQCASRRRTSKSSYYEFESPDLRGVITGTALSDVHIFCPGLAGFKPCGRHTRAFVFMDESKELAATVRHSQQLRAHRELHSLFVPREIQLAMTISIFSG